EHNTLRRGVTTFGEVTDPATVPAAGTATYRGIVYGWHSPNAATTPEVFRGTATVTVDFATRQSQVTFTDTATYTATPVPVPAATLATNVAMGAAGANVANYRAGPIANGAFNGGLSARYFGPVISAGASGTGPTE